MPLCPEGPGRICSEIPGVRAGAGLYPRAPGSSGSIQASWNSGQALLRPSRVDCKGPLRDADPGLQVCPGGRRAGG